MTNKEIIEYFDSSNITLSQLSKISGKSIKELKKLLIKDAITRGTK